MKDRPSKFGTSWALPKNTMLGGKGIESMGSPRSRTEVTRMPKEKASLTKRPETFLLGGLATVALVGAGWWLSSRRKRNAPERPSSPHVRPMPPKVFDKPENRESVFALPSKGKPVEDVLSTMKATRKHDANWHDGRTWSLVFHAGDEVTDLLKQAYTTFFSENGLNPMAFPSLKKFEAEAVAMTANLLGGDRDVVGNMTSGGTESILMAVKTAREWAKANRPYITAPEMILPSTAHPAFHKAAHYFGLKTIQVPVLEDFRADGDACRAAVTPNTILMVGSAPSYPQGVIDPIVNLAAIAHEHNILFHVDACVGGFMLPFVRRLGYPVPDFDFSVEGVTSISVDLHKYAYAAKGASVILYRTHALRRYQFFVHSDWSGGIYASPTMAGTRPGGTIAAAWAIMNHLGEEGYLSITGTVMNTVTKLREGIGRIDGVRVLGDPAMSILALGSDRLNIYEIGDELTLRGWHMDRQQLPPSLHLTVTHAHAQVADQFLEDLAQAVEQASRISLVKLSNSLRIGLVEAAGRVLPADWMSALAARSSSVTGLKGAAIPGRSAAMYGMMASLPNRGDLDELVRDLLDQMTQPEQPHSSP
jgi:sphinganine-1-phosphate aldolase